MMCKNRVLKPYTDFNISNLYLIFNILYKTSYQKYIKNKVVF